MALSIAVRIPERNLLMIGQLFADKANVARRCQEDSAMDESLVASNENFKTTFFRNLQQFAVLQFAPFRVARSNDFVLAERS